MRTRTTLIALLLLVAASACSGGGSTAASNNTSSSSTSASSTTTTTLPPLTAAGANAALLTVAELPGSFTDQGWDGGSLRQGASCAQSATDPGVDTTVPARVTVGLGAKDALAIVQEELRAYDDVVTATSAFDTMSRGETCASGTMFRGDGTTFPLQIDPPVDVKADLGTDVATKWVEHAPGFDVQFVAARVGDVIFSFDTVTFSGPFPAFLGSPLDLPKTALTKAKTALIR